MLAYHNQPDLKAKALDIMASHRKAETLEQNRGYWINGKGCAVGCLLHDLGGTPDRHADYERLLGIPEPLARLEDDIFEFLPAADSQAWPERFLGAIQPGADLSRVIWQFLDWLLSDLPEVKYADVTAVVARVRTEVTKPLARGETVTKEVAHAAYAAADAARAAIDAAHAAIDAAYAAIDAAHAAIDAAYAAIDAAYAVDAAAYAAAYAARAARAADAARKQQADKLIELLKAA